MRVVLALMLMCPAVASAANWADERDYPDLAASKTICAQVRTVQLPDPQRVDRRQHGGMAGCRSEALYYGIGHPADAKAAFACAQLEAADSMFGGDMMLMTLYANGKGTARDVTKAIALACRLDGAPMESHGRVLSLEALRTSAAGQGEFHWCDDITSGYAMGQCASHQQRIAEAGRDADFNTFKARWSQGDAAVKLDGLIKAAKDFAQSRQAETDQSGTARGAMIIAAEEEVMTLLHQDLAKVSPSSSAFVAAFGDGKADAELNQVYKKVMATDFGTLPGVPTKEGIKSVQRTWLKYRDAWVAFVKAAAPEISSQAVVNLQTRHRVVQLQDMVAE